MIALGAGGGLLGGLGVSGAKKVGIENALKKIVENMNLATNAILVVVLIGVAFLLFLGIKKILNRSFEKKLANVRISMPKLKTDLILFRHVDALNDKERLVINNSIQEIVKNLKENLGHKSFHKRFGVGFCDKTLKYLDHISNNDIDIESLIDVVDSWIDQF